MPPKELPVGAGRLLSVGVHIASFLLPLLGIVLFFVYRRSNSKMARTAIIAAALGMALNLVLLLVKQ